MARSLIVSRRNLLRRILLGTAGIPLLGSDSLLSGRALAATEESPETENNWEGPFYKGGAPVRSVLLEKGVPGTPLTVSGRVLDLRGRPSREASTALKTGRPRVSDLSHFRVAR